jgi:hypothetical protein
MNDERTLQTTKGTKKPKQHRLSREINHIRDEAQQPFPPQGSRGVTSLGSRLSNAAFILWTAHLLFQLV